MEWITRLTGQVVAIDTAPFIYFIEQHAKYLPIVEPFFAAIDAGHFQAVTSTLTLIEVLIHPLQNGNQSLANRYRDILLRSRGFKIVPVSATVAERAARIRATSKMQIPDAIQIAGAEESGAR